MRNRFSAVISAILCLTVILSTFAPLDSARAAKGVKRAVIVGCGSYAGSYVSLGDVPFNDADLMLRILVLGGVGPIKLLKGTTKQQLLSSIKDTFADAGPDDVSYVYFSGHGEIRSGQSTLVLSNGQANYTLTATELESALSAIPGTKVIILDACHVGGFIAKSVSDSKDGGSSGNDNGSGASNQKEEKGLSPSAFDAGLTAPFRKEGYKLLVAASVFEYAWSSVKYSHFTYALAEGLGAINGRYMADYNSNGVVSLSEAYDWVYSRNRSSKAQVFPQKDSKFGIASYKLSNVTQPRVSNFYGRQVTTSELIDKPVSVHFTLRSPCVVEAALEVVNDEWNERQLYKTISRKNYPAGKHSVTLTGADVFNLPEGDYALTIIVGSEWDLENYTYYFTVRKPETIRIGLNLDREVLSADGVTEMAIHITYVTMCAITLEIRNSSGERVRRLAIDDEARPTHYPDHSELLYYNSYYWDGRDDYGNLVPSGVYTIWASAVGSTRGNTVSGKIMVSR